MEQNDYTLSFRAKDSTKNLFNKIEEINNDAENYDFTEVKSAIVFVIAEIDELCVEEFKKIDYIDYAFIEYSAMLKKTLETSYGNITEYENSVIG